MAIVVVTIILTVALAIAYQLSKRKSKKRKYIVWGITTMLAIAPLFSWLTSISYAGIEGKYILIIVLIRIKQEKNVKRTIFGY